VNQYSIILMQPSASIVCLASLMNERMATAVSLIHRLPEIDLA
jgi:hypothetical protein